MENFSNFYRTLQCMVDTAGSTENIPEDGWRVHSQNVVNEKKTQRRKIINEWMILCY